MKLYVLNNVLNNIFTGQKLRTVEFFEILKLEVIVFFGGGFKNDFLVRQT